MLENRSFDNVAGWLYDPRNPPPFNRPPRGQPFDGLAGKALGNPVPAFAAKADTWPGGHVPASRTDDPRSPDHDPGEGFAHVNTQLFGQIIPAGSNCAPHRPPFNLPHPTPRRAPMNGFVTDYVSVLRCRQGPAGPAQYAQIMAGLTPRALPVLSSLAQAYAICDRWFCSVPAQTWANRSFSLAATSSGRVDEAPLIDWLANRAPTVFNRIDQAHRSDLTWRVYFNPAQTVPLTWLIFPMLRPYLFHNFRPMPDFYRAARTGALPSVTLIEPLMTGPAANDEHPPTGVGRGERLLLDVYRALREGPGWPRTLCIVTFDEHGGLYDHVPPPAAIPPDPGAPPGQFGFRFDRLGPRVCTLLISPFVEAGTVFRAHDLAGHEAALDHTAIVRTICQRFGLPSLTRRDAASAGVAAVLTRGSPRSDRPQIPAPMLLR